VHGYFYVRFFYDMKSKDYTKLIEIMSSFHAVTDPYSGVHELDVQRTLLRIERFRGFLIRQKNKAEKLEQTHRKPSA
jgi:hypothetical protein